MTKEEVQKRIAIMQAYVDGKTIEYRENKNEDWKECKNHCFFGSIEYRVKPELPTSWEEFCENNPIRDCEAYIEETTSYIFECCNGAKRHYKDDANVYPSKELAEAALAQAQLLQLRKACVGDWEPDWTDSEEIKYCITNLAGEVRVFNRQNMQCWLSFPRIELAEKFFNNFRDLIEKAKHLL